MLALALLVAFDVGFPSVDVKPLQQIAFIGDERLCAGEAVPKDVARFARAIPASELVDADVIVVAPSLAQLAVDRGAFMKRIHAELDAVRAVAPKTWIVIAAPNVAHARDWLNAVMHKRGDGALSFVVFPKANKTRDECTTRAVEIAQEVQKHLAR